MTFWSIGDRRTPRPIPKPTTGLEWKILQANADMVEDLAKNQTKPDAQILKELDAK
ncbi:MAG: hypothetical protein JRI86_15390, partial [Deltaproteobacteria bacterium]|nr:hypothetical protein [Deltaproteobacteria bacterium]